MIDLPPVRNGRGATLSRNGTAEATLVAMHGRCCELRTGIWLSHCDVGFTRRVRQGRKAEAVAELVYYSCMSEQDPVAQERAHSREIGSGSRWIDSI